jgi:predicted phosphoadenosine phosphosulfate sulfurtransferase
MSKRYLNKNVYEAAIERIDYIIDTFPAFYVSFSGGKDSGVTLNMVLERAKLKNRLPVPVMFFDWETCYKETVDYVYRMMSRPDVEPYWICLPEAEDNGSSIYERYWKPWDPAKRDKWVRPMPDYPFVINQDNMPEEWREWYDPNSYTLWIVKKFGDWLANKKGVDMIADILGLRTDESYGRHMLVQAQKNRRKMRKWIYQTVDNGEKSWICLPIYDWNVEDVWAAYGKFGWDYNRTYDRFYWAGKTLNEMRICNAFGEVQKKDLDQWHEIEPETWNRLVERVQGANFGAIYNNTNLNRMKTKKPDNMTWEQFTWHLFNSLPPEAQANYKYRFDVIFRWFEIYSRDKMGLERWWFDTKKEAKAFAREKGISIAYVGSWETMANFIIKRDWMCKKYGFKESERTDRAIKALFEKYKDL